MQMKALSHLSSKPLSSGIWEERVFYLQQGYLPIILVIYHLILFKLLYNYSQYTYNFIEFLQPEHFHIITQNQK